MIKNIRAKNNQVFLNPSHVSLTLSLWKFHYPYLTDGKTNTVTCSRPHDLEVTCPGNPLLSLTTGYVFKKSYSCVIHKSDMI